MNRALYFEAEPFEFPTESSEWENDGLGEVFELSLIHI